jgi:hypothetical protein
MTEQVSATVTFPNGRTATIEGATEDAVRQKILELEKENSDIQGMPVTNEPFPRPEDRTFAGTTREGPVYARQPPSDVDISAAERGVDVKTGLTIGNIRSDLGFSPGEAFTADHLATKLAEEYGTEKEGLVRQNEIGEFEYYNKATGRFTLVDERGLSKGDLKDLYGPATTIVPEIGGSIGGAFAGPHTSVWAGGVSAAIGEYFRLAAGKRRGVHDLDAGEMLEEALQVGGISTAAGYAGEVIGFLTNKLRIVISPEGFSEQEARQILKSLDDPETKEMLQQMDEALKHTDQQYKLDVATTSGDEVALALKDTAMKSDMHFAAEMNKQQLANEDALATYLGVKTDMSPSALGDDVASEYAGNAAQAGLRAERRRIEERYARGSANAIADSEAALADLPSFDATAAGKVAREIADTHANSLRGQKKASYLAYQKEIGQVPKTYTSNIRVPVTGDIKQLNKNLNQLVKKSIISKQVSGTKTLKGVKSRRSVDLAVLDDNIKNLRAGIRAAEKGGMPAEFNVQKAQNVADELAKMRDDFLQENYPEAYSALMKAEADNTAYKDFIGKSALKTILRKGDNAIEDIGVLVFLGKYFRQTMVLPCDNLLMLRIKFLAQEQSCKIYCFNFTSRIIQMLMVWQIKSYMNHFYAIMGRLLIRYFQMIQGFCV